MNSFFVFNRLFINIYMRLFWRNSSRRVVEQWSVRDA